MADRDPRDIPDLDLPPPRASQRSVPSARPQPATAPPPSVGEGGGSLGDDFGMALERGNVSSPPASMPRVPASSQVSIEVGSGGDDFDMEIERGGAMVSLPPASSGRPMVSSRPASMSGRPSASGLDVNYRRMDARPVVEAGPATGTRILAWVLPIVLGLGTLGALLKAAHRAGGRNVMSLLPHAFDATSTVQSGSFAGAALVVAIAIGVIGLKAQPRSYAMLGSAFALVITSLAMVTVTLVSTEETPSPPDGALLIPYVVPVAVLLLGIGVVGRGPSQFVRGGGRLVLAAAFGIAGGALIFAAIEISAFASRLP